MTGTHIGGHQTAPFPPIWFFPLHGTIEQAHQKVHKINDAPENKHFCTGAFIDISQAFDKVWHMGLFYKLKQALPHPMYTLLASYLTNRTFQVRCH